MGNGRKGGQSWAAQQQNPQIVPASCRRILRLDEPTTTLSKFLPSSTMDPERIHAYLQAACAGLGMTIGEVWFAQNETGTSTVAKIGTCNFRILMQGQGQGRGGIPVGTPFNHNV